MQAFTYIINSTSDIEIAFVIGMFLFVIVGNIALRCMNSNIREETRLLRRERERLMHERIELERKYHMYM